MEKYLAWGYTGLYVLLLCGLLILIILASGEEIPPFARDPPVFMPLRRVAVFLYRKIWDRCRARRMEGKDLFLPGEEDVRKDLVILYPSLKAHRQEIRFQIIKIERVILILFAGVVLAGAVHVRALYAGILQEDGRIERAETGGEDRTLSVKALPLVDTEATEEESDNEDSANEENTDGADAKEKIAKEGNADGDDAKEKIAKEGNADGGDVKGNNANEGDADADIAEGKDSGQEEPEKEVSDYGTYKVIVHARQYTRAEADARAGEILRRFPETLLGDNPSTDQIRSPLHMPSSADADPFTLSWESSRYAVLDTDGSIFNTEYEPEQAESVELTAILTYGEYRFTKTMAFTIRAPLRDAQDQLYEEIDEALRTAEKESAEQDSFTLPSDAGGRQLTWQEQVEDLSAGVLILGIVAAILLWYVTDYRLHEKIRLRDRQMAVDYPQFISRLVLYMGAGMSVRNVFYKCGEDYREKQKEEAKKRKKEKQDGRKRFLYEEILLVCNELDSGIPESEAYLHFGRRCRSRQYTKLCSLLVQNLRRGNDTLLQVLQEEAQSSFEERKNLARELGEEAGTKLLLPMMIMLSITMLIIIVPAYFSFSF